MSAPSSPLRNAVLRLIGTLCAAGLVSACVVQEGIHPASPESHCSSGDDSYRVRRDITYTPEGWPQALKADIYTPATPGLHPTVLVVHGGGWRGGDREQMENVSELLARCGFTAVSVQYRLAPAWRFPAPVQDLQQAMHWIHTHGAAYGADADRIGAMGYSAGAHLVALLGLIGPGDALDSPYGGEATRLRAVIAGGTPSDLRKFTGGTLVPQFLDGTITQIPERFALSSPVTHIHAGAPPFLLYHGGWDRLVPLDQATDFKAALQSAGVPVSFYRLRGYGHILAYFASTGFMQDHGIAFLHQHLDAHAEQP